MLLNACEIVSLYVKFSFSDVSFSHAFIYLLFVYHFIRLFYILLVFKHRVALKVANNQAIIIRNRLYKCYMWQ